MLRLTILGCASSPGVPRITGDWGACDPTNPRNRRRRSAALIQRITPRGITHAVIDCGPDFREQMLSEAVPRIDGIVITHPHADHIHGLDDIRGYMLEQHHRIAIHADDETYDRLLEAFRYCFEMPAGSSYAPIARRFAITTLEAFEIQGAGGPIGFMPFRQVHGTAASLGFRIGPIAYCSDVSDFPPDAIGALQGVRHIVLDALQYTEHPSHLSVDQALGWIARLGVPAATLTHMHTPLDYETLRRSLPAHVQPAHDGLRIDFEVD